MKPTKEASRRAIVDVGSNSVRLVIYEGPARTPFTVHNEKVRARLGRGLAETGQIDADAYDEALRGCRRFKALLDAAGITDVRTVATAAARDATNGEAFLADLTATGLQPELLSGDAEAYGSAAGVLSAFPGADGVVGDLGGGSLELIDIAAGTPGRRETFPLGVLRLPALREGGDRAFVDAIMQQLKAGGWHQLASGRPFYLVGGSWRALGHLDMYLTDSALPGVHSYTFGGDRIAPLRTAVAELGTKLSKTVAAISASRVPALDDAALLLDSVADALCADRLVVSSFGLREGLLFSALDPAVQAEDPLLAAITDYARRRGNTMWHGDVVSDWIAPVFAAEPAADARLRRAACHLAAVDLHPQSETRARHGMELAWLGGWIGLEASERAMLAQALWTAWGGKGRCNGIGNFVNDVDLRQAMSWGEAIRLAERFGGGVSAVLRFAGLVANRETLTLHIDAAQRDLGGQVIVKQLGALAEALDLSPTIASR